MAQNNMKGIGLIIGLFIFVILMLVFVQSIGDFIFPVTNSNEVLNESLDISTTRTGGTVNSVDNSVGLSLAHNNWSIAAIRNGTVTVFTEGTDYILNETLGLIYFQNTTKTQESSNQTYVDYNWKANDYIENSTSRTMINLVVLFFVIGGVLWVAISAYRKLQEGF